MSHTASGWVLVSISVAALAIGVVGCSGTPDDAFETKLRNVSESPGGRVQVEIMFENVSSQAYPPRCQVNALDADGFRVGQDILSGTTDIQPGESELFDTVTGIDMDSSISRVELDC